MERQLNIAQSTNVKSASYDPDTQKIRVVFNLGHGGSYSGCGEDVATAFEQAESSGKFVQSTLKPLYPYTPDPKIG